MRAGRPSSAPIQSWPRREGAGVRSPLTPPRRWCGAGSDGAVRSGRSTPQGLVFGSGAPSDTRTGVRPQVRPRRERVCGHRSGSDRRAVVDHRQSAGYQRGRRGPACGRGRQTAPLTPGGPPFSQPNRQQCPCRVHSGVMSREVGQSGVRWLASNCGGDCPDFS